MVRDISLSSATTFITQGTTWAVYMIYISCIYANVFRAGIYLYSVAMFAIVKPILLYGDRSRENSVGVHHLVVTNGLEVKQ